MPGDPVMAGAPSSVLALVAMPFVRSSFSFLVAMPGAPSSFWLILLNNGFSWIGCRS